MAMLGASDPTIESLLLGQLAELPPVRFVHPALALESGEAYLARVRAASSGASDPFVLVVEGSIADEAIAGRGSFSRLGTEHGEPITVADWVERLAPRAAAVVAIGSCAAWGGIPAAHGNPTGAMGLDRFLGREFHSRAGLPVVNVPGCAPSGDAFLDALAYTILALQGVVPLELDEDHRPGWLYRDQAHPAPPRQAGIAPPSAGPSVGCHVPGRGWMGGIGGCARVGGACIGCTARGFADRFIPLARPVSGGT